MRGWHHFACRCSTVGFAISFVWARSASMCVRTLNRIAAGCHVSGTSLRYFCLLMLDLLSQGPRVVAFEAEELPPWIYADSASEPSGSGQTVSIGGVFYESSSLRPTALFSKVQPTRVYSDWAKDKLQMIAEVELFAALVAKKLWCERIRDRAIFHAIDRVAA
eukprot:1740256-Amphidinium_carterae.1